MKLEEDLATAYARIRELEAKLNRQERTQTAMEEHARAKIDQLEAKLASMPEPGATIIELNKRVRALQIRLEKARKAGFVHDQEDP